MGVTKKTHQGPRRRAPEGNRAPRRSSTRFRRRPRAHSGFFNRNTTSGARALAFAAVRRPREKHGDVKKRGFSKGTSHLLLRWRARDATNAPFWKRTARERSRDANSSFSLRHTFPASLVFFMFPFHSVSRKVCNARNVETKEGGEMYGARPRGAAKERLVKLH